MPNKFTKREMIYGVPHKRILEAIYGISKDVKKNTGPQPGGWQEATKAWKAIAFFYRNHNTAHHIDALELAGLEIHAKYKELENENMQCFVDCYKNGKKVITGSGHSLIMAFADAYKQL